MGLNQDSSRPEETRYLIEDFPHIHASMYCGAESLDFHRSWDWLMPVAKKINELPPIKDKLRDSITPHIYAMRRMKKGAIQFDIAETYNGVVDFIKWYNTQNPKQG